MSTRAKPFKRVLIANRGEIALRIQRACVELGLETVQVYSEADRHSLPVRLADHAVCIGPAPSRLSYLDADLLVGTALAHGADAIHPGYGFLSENAGFADLCADAGIEFVGPSSHAIRTMGDKATARKVAAQARVPTTPGSEGVLSGPDMARTVANDIGYPVLLKASAGGGGRGMRVVTSSSELETAYSDAAREAQNAFGNDSLYLEKYLTRARHIEIQVLGDGRNVLHVGERDCSVQRRNQKLIEEGPSPALNADLREQIGAAAIKLCREVGYRSAGTVEFILDELSGKFYFMEMNTRIQVEHPVTEMITGIDLVKAQLLIARDGTLKRTQADVRIHGHAMEFRINAEDSENNFMPSPGEVTGLHLPGGPGVRVDTHLFAGYVVPPNYDSLLAKVIVWGENRSETLERARRALRELRIDGVKTTTSLHLRLLGDQEFCAGRIHTRYLETFLRP